VGRKQPIHTLRCLPHFLQTSRSGSGSVQHRLKNGQLHSSCIVSWRTASSSLNPETQRTNPASIYCFYSRLILRPIRKMAATYFCGVCLFSLSPEISVIDEDTTDVSSCSNPEPPGMPVQVLERSAKRNCVICMEVLETFRREGEFKWILWQNYCLLRVTSFIRRQNGSTTIEFTEWEISIEYPGN
jgi:hypothetical protein